MRETFYVLGLLVILGLDPGVSALTAHPESSSQDPLTEEQMKRLAEQTAQNENPQASLRPLRSKNSHLGEKEIPNPLQKHAFWCVFLGESKAAPRRKFLCVNQSGKVLYPFDPKQFGNLLSNEDLAGWKDDDYLKAAMLYVHLTSVANQDGWKLLQTKKDFLSIRFNMESVGEGPKKREKVAELITKPTVVKEKKKVTVKFYAWHLIGGALREWTLEFGLKFKAHPKKLGNFGGGGYD